MAFTTILTPAECCARLQAKCASWPELVKSGFTRRVNLERPIYGRVTERGFRLFVRITYGNGYQTRAKGHFREEADGTHVDVRFGISTFALASPAVVPIE